MSEQKNAIKPPVPDNCLVVLTIVDGRITGFTNPDYFKKDDCQWRVGCSFLCLTQEMIDKYISGHSESVDEEHSSERNQRELMIETIGM